MAGEWWNDLLARGEDAVNNTSQQGSTKAPDFADTPIWIDDRNQVTTADAADRRGGPTRVALTTTVANTRNYVLGLAGAGGPGYQRLAQNLYRKGALYDMRYASNVNSVMEANDRAMAMYLASPFAQKIPYARWLSGDYAVQEGRDGSNASGGGGSAYGPFTNTTVSLTNEFDARALVDNALRQYLGRDATAKERKGFWQQLNAAEKKHPSVDSGVTSKGGTSRVTSGGVGAAGAQTMAEDFAMSRDDYAETQGSTTLLGWMTESIMKDKTEGLM